MMNYQFRSRTGQLCQHQHRALLRPGLHQLHTTHQGVSCGVFLQDWSSSARLCMRSSSLCGSSRSSLGCGPAGCVPVRQ
jgi:hypothetical protein